MFQFFFATAIAQSIVEQFKDDLLLLLEPPAPSRKHSLPLIGKGRLALKYPSCSIKCAATDGVCVEGFTFGGAQVEIQTPIGAAGVIPRMST